MKKLSIFVLVIFAATAFANPFSDVKFNHWAYDAVSKLAAKGIITGYPDGTFKGTKSVTRYDMAVIIARLMEQVGVSPSLKAKMSKGDLDSVQKLVVEFADELSLLGVKVTALEDEMSAVKDDLAVLKEDVRTLKATGGQGGKIRITGDIRQRFQDFGYEETAVEAIFNENFFESLLGLNLDMMIDPDVTACLRLERTAYWNTQNGDWTTGAGTGPGFVVNRDTDLQTALGYIQIKDFFGWADQMRFGRQRIALGHDLLIKGVADGITFLKTVDNKREIVCRVGGFKLDDADTGTLAVANDNEGLDLAYMDWTFDLHDVMAELYVIHSREPMGVIQDTVTAWKNVKRQTWYGIAASGNPVPELTLWGEYAWLNFDESVDLNGIAADTSTEDGDNGFLVGLNWDANRRTVFKLQYMAFDQYFWKPQGTGFNTIWDVDTYLDPATTWLYDAAGYRMDFDDIMAEINYQITDKSTIIGRYERIDDNTNLVAGQVADDRNILTGIFKYQYKPNTAITLQYRQVSCEDSTGAAAGDQVVAPATTNVARLGRVDQGHVATVVDGLGIVDPSLVTTVAPDNIYYVDDVTEFRLQLDVNF
jgi:hypothetical protein